MICSRTLSLYAGKLPIFESMKKLTLLSSILAALTVSLYAADTKITGDASCAKCDLKQADACQMAIKVKNADGKEEIILAENNKVAKDFHSNICKSTEKVNAEGTITEKGGKKTIVLSKVELAK
jgi:hypothetical protein